MNASCKFRSLTLIPLVFGLFAGVGGAPVLKGQTGRIVFEHAPDGGDPRPTLDIYSVNADGTGLRALTTDGHSHSPSWSPDGRHILYIHDTSWPNSLPKREIHIADNSLRVLWQSHFALELYVMDSDGGNAHLLRQLDGHIGNAAWSPDGKTLAVCYSSINHPPSRSEPRLEGETNLALFAIPAEGSGEPQLLFQRACFPSWKPDGSKLAFAVQAVVGSVWTIAVGDADGSHRILLFDPYHDPEALDPAWSPDGTQIAFNSPVTLLDPSGTRIVSQQQQIFLMRADGSGRRQLTNDPQWTCLHPTWSPDGTEIAFYGISASAPCSFLAMALPGCIRRIFVLSLRDPHAKPIQITQHDGAFPVFAPVP
jgi:Tol biopolymer transport system component